MVKRFAAAGLLALAALAVIGAFGCGPSTDLTGSPIPNAMPDTRVTARPPDVLEAGSLIQFYWTGFDPDGRIVGYQWKMSDNGIDGISVQDTLTFDPVTGDTLNPWIFTLSSDSTFLVSADIPDFPNDPDGVNRSYQTHTFLVRAVDEDGGVDPTPAYVSFNYTTLLPTVRMVGPSMVTGVAEVAGVPSTVTVFYDGTDSDSVTGVPVAVRYLWLEALLPDESQYLRSRNDYNRNLDYFVDFADSAWTEWQPYGQDEESRRISIPDVARLDPQGRQKTYILALQSRDVAGAVSIQRGYGQQVANVEIVTTLSPPMIVSERFLGSQLFSGTNGLWTKESDVAGGQQMSFTWTASAASYGGRVVSYRYGWDLADPDDPNDPNWALQPGTTFAHRNPPPVFFEQGSHVLTIEARDDSDQVTRATIAIDVVEIPDPANQRDLLLVDDLFDDNSGGWNVNGVPLDDEPFRDAFWIGPAGVLTGPGGVAGWDADAFTIDTRSDPFKLDMREIFNYRATVWLGRFNSTNGVITSDFRPIETPGADIEKFVWLVPYQQAVGNLFYVGEQALTSFLSGGAPYEVPIVFESREGNDGGYQDDRRLGFGIRELPDGSTERAGLTLYPFAALGVSVVDLTSAQGYYLYGTRGQLLRSQRRASCVGVKGLTVDRDFSLKYSTIGQFARTIWSEPSIDVDNPFADDPLGVPYTWGADEIYNADIIGRGTPFTIQAGPEWGCGDDDLDLCVEPMFRSYSRFDWIKMRKLEADPNSTWPEEEGGAGYGGPGQDSLSDVCGDRAFASTGRAITHNRTVAFLTNKTVAEKPSRVGDIVFGFDPYRFDHGEMAKVIRWVLGEHFGLDMGAGGQ